MRFSLRQSLAFLGSAVLLSCTDNPTSPRSVPTAPRRAIAALPAVRFSEIHYDNVGTDAGEAIEISGPAGTDVTGWKIILYNGTGGASYDTKTLTGAIPATCGTRGVISTLYAVNGIQNGSPDGMALVDASNNVVQFLSYEGTFTAADGPAAGMLSVDIGVAEAGTEALGMSLQLDGSGVWHAPAPSTFGACNDADVVVVGPLASITVTPASATINNGATQQFTAAGFDAGGHPVTATFAWTSSATAVATIDPATGLATAKSVGDATITATSGTITGTALLHVTGGTQPPPGSVHISEIHYDNIGTDVGEAIEVEAPAGADLTGWSVVLYNGDPAQRRVYNTTAIAGALAACGTRAVTVLSYPANGIQNGNPDGMALVNASGQAVEFLSYGGTFIAADGPAAGQTSVDIGVAESNASTPVGSSLQRDGGTGIWSGPLPATFGLCNPVTTPTAPIVISELMADPLHAAGGASFGEWFEVYNAGATPVNMQGWTIVSQGQPNHTIAASLIVPAGGFAVLGRGADPAQNGGISIDYNYFTGTSSTTIFLDATDFLVLRDATGARVDSVRWTNTNTMVKGVTRAVRDPLADNSNVDGTNWGYSTVPFGDGDLGTPHLANGTLDTTPPAIPNSISFTGRLTSDPPLPLGFEDQLFATERDGSGNTINTTFTWKSETPALASIDANGVMHALAEGTATFRATATDGTTATFSLPMALATPSTTAAYGNNTEFGDPTDADPSDDFIVRRPQYTTSFNKNRGTPNWVAYDLDASQFGSNVDRCDCFTFDPALPATFTHYTTADYTGAGAFAGFGIDRGHLARSFDRTAGTLDNATTYYFSNIVPQAADLNQGPWAILENFLGDMARLQNKEVYIIAGVAGNKGTVKGEGKIVIPAFTWKVAVIMPRDQGLANIHDYRDLDVIAVIMPNEPGVRNVDWHTYQTTVDAVEALSGYDLLKLLPDNIERAVESNTKPPIGSLDGPYASSEGSSVNMSAAASIDPNGTIVSYAWTLGDGTTASGATIAHTYTQDGDYAVRLIVTDNDGLVDTVNTTAHVTNVAPAIVAPPGVALFPGEQYTGAGSFTDPGADPWTATVNYGDGSGTSALALTGKTFSLSHVYTTPGAFSITIRVSDDDVTSLTTVWILVNAPAQGVRNTMALVDQLVASGKLSSGNGNSLDSKLDAALTQIDAGKNTPAANQLNAFLNELDAMVKAGRLASTDADAIRAIIQRVIASLSH
jgi:DNA/RNA endonuclease G (NUC1)/chitodextrinase